MFISTEAPFCGQISTGLYIQYVQRFKTLCSCANESLG